MALILSPAQRTTKPPQGAVLNAAHPLAAGLRLYIPFTEGGGAARDVVTGRLAYVPNGTNSAWGVRPGGMALTTVGANLSASLGGSGVLAADPQWQIAAPLTVLCDFHTRTVGFANTCVLWGATNETLNAGNNGYSAYINSGDSSHHVAFWAGASFVDLSIGALTQLRRHQIAITYDGATVKFWADGILKASAAHTGALLYPTTGFQVGQEGDTGSGDDTLTDAYAIAIWNRALSGAQLEQMWATPYAMLVPPAPTRRLFVVGAAAGNNPLAGTGAIVTGGTAGLSQTIALAGTGTITTGGTAALIQTQALAGIGAIVTGGNATLSTSGNNPLAGTGAIQTGGTGNLTQVQPLAGAGAIVTSGTAALTQTQALAGTGLITTGGTAALSNTGGGSGTANFVIGVNNAGTGGNDMSPAAVRDSSNRLWRAANTSGTTDFTNSGGQYNNNTLRMYRADQDQVPSSFTEKDSAHRPTNIGTFSLAIDGSDLIHVAYVSPYAAAVPGIYYVTFNTTTNLWGTPVKIGTANYATTAAYLPGDAGVALALDAAGVPHVVSYGQVSGTGATHIFYTNKTSGSWSSALQLDTATLNANQRCMHPACMFDSTGALHVAWMTITFNYGTTLEKCYYIKRSAAGTFGSVTTFAENLLGSLDNGPALYVSEDDHIHIVYGQGDGTNPVSQSVNGTTVNNAVFYRVSSDGGATWNTTTQPPHYVSHNFALGPDGTGGIHLWSHSQPTTVDGLGTAIGYASLAKGSGTWVAWAQKAIDTNGDGFDCSVSPRRETFFHNRPAYLDIAYTDANLPVSVMLGSDPAGNALVGQTETGTILTGGTATLTSSGANALAGTGVIVTGGTAALLQVQALAGTGAIVTSGTGALTQTQALAGTGAIISGGSAALSQIQALAGTGTITTTGTAALSQTQALAGAGAILTGGTANLTQTQALAGSGAIVTGGTAGLTQTQLLSGTGTITTGGTATLTVSGNGALAGSGAITVGGSATLTQVQRLAGTGSIGTGGTATLSVVVNLSGTGTIATGGTASLRQTQALSGTGSITTAGLALLSQTHVLAGAGAIVTSGTATLTNGSLTTFGTVTLTVEPLTTVTLTTQALATIALTVTDEEGVIMDSYVVGNVAHLNAVIKDITGINVDAGTVTVSAKPPKGVIFTPVAATHGATGIYTYDYDVDLPGTHAVRVETVNPKASAQCEIYGVPSLVA